MHFVCFQRHEMDACRRKFQLWIQNLKNSFFLVKQEQCCLLSKTILMFVALCKMDWITTSVRQSTLSSQHNLRLKMTSIKMHLQGFLENKCGTGAWTWKFKFIKLYWHNRCSVQISPCTVWMWSAINWKVIVSLLWLVCFPCRHTPVKYWFNDIRSSELST